MGIFTKYIGKIKFSKLKKRIPKRSKKKEGSGLPWEKKNGQKFFKDISAILNRVFGEPPEGRTQRRFQELIT